MSTIQELGAAQAELGRCLRTFVSLFPDPDFRAYLPELVLDTGYPPVPEQPLETGPGITLYRSELTHPPEDILAILLHKTIHAFHAFRWQWDCTARSYHTQVFRRQAEQVGFQVAWTGRHYGWARTVPKAPLWGLFEDLALAEDVFAPLRDPFPRRQRSWHCGQRRFPDRADLATQLGRCCSDSRRFVRTLRVHRREASPMVRFAGAWLVPFGFREGTPLKVEATYGRVTIEARAFGEEPKNRGMNHTPPTGGERVRR